MKRIVIKVGTGVLTNSSEGTLDTSSLRNLVRVIADFVVEGHQCFLVSSGAVGAGVLKLGLENYPQDIITRQVCAAVGQSHLVQVYENLFEREGIHVAQLLLTGDDFSAEKRRKNVENTLNKMNTFPKIIPIINENDTVATEELSVGDNDMLSAQIATMIKADYLFLLSHIDGLIDPNTGEIARIVEDVEKVFSFVSEEKGNFSIGGMGSKLNAVKFATRKGVETFILNGRSPDRIRDLLNDQGVGTKFLRTKV